MRTLRNLTQLMMGLVLAAVVAATAQAADPGQVYPAASEVSDQKAGSVLVYNLYTSSATAATTQNTRISITNTSSTSAACITS